MIDETLQIKIQVDSQQGQSNITNLSNGLTDARDKSAQVAASMGDVKSAVSSLRLTNLVKTVSQLKNMNTEITKTKDLLTQQKKKLSDLMAQGKNDNALQQSIQQTEGNLANLKESFSQMKNQLGEVGKMALSFAFILGLVKSAIWLVKNAIEVAAMGDKIKDEAAKVYMSTTAYQEWGYVLQQNGVEIGNLKTSMRTFAKQVASNNAVLRKYGITATNVSDAFEQAVFNIQNLGTETEKIAAATELFGNRASELMPILNMTNQETQSLMNTYRAIGGTMSNELIAASDKLTDSITEMKAAWQGLKHTLGQVVMPIITWVVQKLTIAIAYINVFLSVLFGITKTFDSDSGLGGASAGVSKNLDNAVGSAKELKYLISGFDSLNIYSSQKGGSSAGAEDVGGGGGASLNNVIDNDTLQKLQKFQDFLEKNKNLVTLIGALLGAGLLAGIIGSVSKLLGLGLSFSKVLGIALAIVGAITMVSAAIDMINNGITNANLVDYLIGAAALVGGLALAFGTVGAAIGLLVSGLGLLVIGIKEWIETGELSAETANAIAAGFVLVGAAISLLTGSWIPLVVAVVLAAATEIYAHWDEIVAWFKQAWEDIKTWAVNTWNSISEFASKAWDKVKEVWGKVTGWFNEKIITPIKNAFTKCWDGIKEGFEKSFESIKNIGKTIINSILGFIEGFVNGAIKAFNKIINGINDVIGTAGDVIGINTRIGLIQEISIPKLASGAVLTTPTIAMMGEYAGAKSNPEIVAPKSMLESIYNSSNDELADVFVKVGREIINAIDGKDMSVSIDSKTIGTAAKKANNSFNKRTGYSLI